MVKMKKVTTVSCDWETRRKLDALRWDLRKRTYNDILTTLVELRKVTFQLEKNGSKREVIGPLIHEKLVEGWQIVGYSLKDDIKEEA